MICSEKKGLSTFYRKLPYPDYTPPPPSSQKNLDPHVFHDFSKISTSPMSRRVVKRGVVKQNSNC